MNELPSGQVTFLFTDIEGSTRYWERIPEAMPAVYAHHDAVLRAEVERHGGVVFKVIGDAFQVAFPSAIGALHAAVEAQRLLLNGLWPVSRAPRVRMALHQIDVAPESDGDYRSAGLNRLGRLLGAADGGQILVSDSLFREIAGTQDSSIQFIDLGLHQFRDLAPLRVHQVMGEGLPSDIAALRSLTPHRHNLPRPATRFIGRVFDLETCAAQVLDPDVRVLTLIGPGGIGKTRMAIETASRVQDAFADGVWFVPLAAVSDPEWVLAAIAEVLGVRESVDETIDEALVTHLAAQDVLLVLDNVEHVADAAPRIGRIASECPRLTILATSRVPLAIAGEREFPIFPLSVSIPASSGSIAGAIDPVVAGDAVHLFVDRTRAAVPGFTITTANIAVIATICQRLDGLPLAIELAAARSRILPPAKLLERLENRLALLTGGPRDMPARQQTLRSAIDWSVDLLTPDEKRLFEWLAVFAGGATLEAIESVCGGGDVQHHALDTVDGLVRQSLLVSGAGSGEARFQMLETIREYARERLAASGSLDAAAGRHATYFLKRSTDAEAHLSGPDQIEWLDALQAEHDNLRTALTHLDLSGNTIGLCQMAGALWRFWWVRGYLSEGRAWLQRALRAAESAAVPGQVLARVYDGAGALAEAQGNIDSAFELHERALVLLQKADDRLGQARSMENLGIIALHDRGDPVRARELHGAALALFRAAGDRPGIASSLKNLGDVALLEEAFPEATACYTQSLVVARELRDTRGIAVGLTSLGALAFFLGDLGRAVDLYEESLPLWRQLDDRPGIALTLGNLGEALDHSADVARALPLYEESLSLARELDDRQGIAFALSHLGRIARQHKDLVAAAGYYTESADVARDIGDDARLAESIEGLAGVLLDSGEPSVAARLLGTAKSVRITTESPMHSIHLASHLNDLGQVRAALGDDAAAKLMAEGAAWQPDGLPLDFGHVLRVLPGDLRTS